MADVRKSKAASAERRHNPTVLTVLALSVLSATSCKPPTERVYVNVDAIVGRETRPRPKSIRIPSPPTAMSRLTMVQPGRPPSTLVDPSTSSESDVRRAMAVQQQRDYERLVKRLTDFYEADALRFEQEQLRTQTEKTNEAYEEALARIRALFEAYAKRHGPVLAQLTIISGFPDPNPNSTPPRRQMTKARRYYFERAKALRDELRSIDAQYDAQADQVVSGVADDVQRALAEIDEQVRKYRLANELRAEREAAQQVRRATQELGLRLAEPVRISLPEVARSPVVVPGAPAPSRAPVVRSDGVLAEPADRRLLVERELRIWMGQNRYVPSPIGPGVIDRTSEFETWRNRRTVGR